MKIKRTFEDYFIDIFCYVFLTILCISIVIPFMQIITLSFSPAKYITSYGLKLFPKEITLDGFRNILRNSYLWVGYKNTILVTLIGTTCNVIGTSICAYALAKKDLPGRNYITAFIVFTMYFGGGTIPTYLVFRELNLIDTYAVYIIPGIISSYNMIITRNFFMSLPKSLEESARVDGAGLFRIFAQIVLPLSKPILATIALWYGVAHWNQWRDSLIYVPSADKHLLQYALRQILFEGSLTEEVEDFTNVVVNTETMKNAALLVATVPILCVYPFIQKYFVKGVMVGSLKG